MPQPTESTIPRYIDSTTVMAHKYTYHTKEYFWGETFYTDRRLSVISDLSTPGLVEDHSEDSEASGDDDYHLSSTKLFDTYHDTPLRAASTLLTQVNRTYARENHQYPNFPLSRSGARRSIRRNSNVLQSLESYSDDPRPKNRFYGTWPLCNETNQAPCNRLSVPVRPSVLRTNTQPNPTARQYPLGTASITVSNARCSSQSPEVMEVVNQERSYFEHSDDEGSDDEDSSGSLTGKAMKRLHIRSPSGTKIGEMKASSLRRFFRSSKKL